MPLFIAALAVTAISAGVKVHNQRKARKSQIEAAEKEALFLESQAVRTRKASERQMELLELERNEVFGDQVTAIAANNIDLSGSALDEVLNTGVKFDEEGRAIRQETDFDVQLSMLRARETRMGAQRIARAGKTEDFATILGGVTQVAGAAAGRYGAGSGSTRGSTSNGSGAAAASSSSPSITSSQIRKPR